MPSCSNIQRLLEITLLLLLGPHLWAAQPADTDADSVISAGELAAFVSVANSDSEAARRAVNIWKHGESYRSITGDGTTYHVPAPASGRTFIAPATLNPVAADSVIIYGLPAHAAGYDAFYYDTGAEDVVFGGTVAEREGAYHLFVPPHPVGAMAGGDLEFVIYPADGQPTPANSYHTGTMSVQGLTAAPGTLAALRQKTDVLVAQIGQESGIDFSEYFAGGPSEHGPFKNELEQTLVLLVRYLKDPQFPGGLVEIDEQILDGSSPFLVDMRDQIDAMLARTDVLEWIDEHGDRSVPVGASALRLAGDEVGEAARAGAVKTLRIASDQVGEAALPPTDGTSLNRLMLDQYVSAWMLENSALFGDEVGLSLTAVGLAGAPGAVAAALPAVTISLMKRDYERMARTYPAVGKIEANFSETAFYADDCAVSGSWSATASVSSLGWSTDGANMDVAISVVGVGGAAADAVKYAKAVGDGAKAAEGATRAAARSQDIQAFYENAGQSAAEEAAMIVAEQRSAQEVPPETWESIPLTESHAEMKQVGDPVLNVVGESYTPIRGGTVKGYISPGNRESGVLFPPGVMEASDPVTITVKEAGLTLAGCPPTTYTPGELYTLTASVEGLRDPDVPYVWNATAGDIIPVPGSVAGQAQAIWTAPDPAPAGIVSITALAEADICIPEGAQYPTASCTTRGSDYELVLNPEKSCYEPGDVVTLTLRNMNNLSATPETEYEVVTGVATVVGTGPNTAELTSTQIGEVGVTARLASDPNQLLTATMTFGCDDGTGLALGPAKHGMQKLSFNTDYLHWYTLFGSFSASDGVITAEFDAASTFQYHVAEDPEDPGPYGFVGINPLTPGVPIINPGLSISLQIPYTTIPCGPVTLPGMECLEALSVDENSVVIQGLSIDYALDPFFMGSRITTGTETTYTILLIPENNTE